MQILTYGFQSMMSIESEISLVTELNLTERGTVNHRRIANGISPCSKLFQHHPLQEEVSTSTSKKKDTVHARLQPQIAGRLKSTTKNVHGRWLVRLELASPDTTLTVVTAYRVCKDSGAPESSSIAARERRSLMWSLHKEAHDPRKAFITDITNYLCEVKQKGHKLLLCMDANIPWNHKDIQTLKRDLGLKDLMAAVANRDSPSPATYDRGDASKGPINLALGCQATANALLTVCFHDFTTLTGLTTASVNSALIKTP